MRPILAGTRVGNTALIFVEHNFARPCVDRIANRGSGRVVV